QQEDPHQLEPQRGHERQLLVDLRVVEAPPPPHRLAAGPVVHAEDERLSGGGGGGPGGPPAGRGSDGPAGASARRSVGRVRVVGHAHFSTPVMTMPRMNERCVRRNSATGTIMPSSAVAWSRCGCCE